MLKTSCKHFNRSRGILNLHFAKSQNENQ